MYLKWLIALCGPLQTIILAFLRFLTTARMEDSGSALDFSCLSVVQEFFWWDFLFFWLWQRRSEFCSDELRSVLGFAGWRHMRLCELF